MKALAIDDLRGILQRIDGRGYKAYQDLRGLYAFGAFLIEIAHVQGDPYAPPSRLHARIALESAGFESAAAEPEPVRTALEDFLGRALAAAIESSGAAPLTVDRFGQEILRRTVVRVHRDHLEARLCVELPAAGRRVLGREAARILLGVLPRVLANGLERKALDSEALARHCAVAADYAFLADSLEKHGWIAFVADGALLPRRAGGDERPLAQDGSAPLVRFQAPGTLCSEVTLPHGEVLRGMAIPRGVTLLVGGGFHGKSTLLHAIARGIYPHIPGDGRERVVSHPRTVKVRAEDGRAVTRTDITPFIGELPCGRSTQDFTTTYGSGSTSQAANIIEALEAGARVLLLDEDTSATNFMIRDEPMRRLLRPGQEPITPFLDRVRNLWRDRGVSCLLVVGGSGEYFRVADRVIQMDCYVPVDVTSRARELVTDALHDENPFPQPAAPRRLRLDRYREMAAARGPRVRAVGMQRLLLGREEVDLTACEQLVSPAQLRMLGEILERLIEGRGNLGEELVRGLTATQLSEVMLRLGADDLDGVSRFSRGDLAAVRSIEVMAMLNRLRALEVDR